MKTPRSQGELIRLIRGTQTQTEFAKVLGVDRTCLSRYEREALGAPTSVINYCLEQLAQHFSVASPQEDPLLDDALEDTRRALQALERMKLRSVHAGKQSMSD